MKTHLTSIAEHSDWLENRHNNSMTKWNLHRLRIEFGKQQLAIWQFVPCKLVDGVWVVLEEPKEHLENRSLYFKELNEYQQAKERCLFEVFEWKKAIFYKENKKLFWHGELEGTIEDLIKYNLELTQTAQKTIGL